jgi:hypothetical protein
MSDPTTFIWLTLSGAVFSAFMVFVAGILVGLCCGMRASALRAHGAGRPLVSVLASTR